MVGGGSESFNEWLERGPIYAFRFDRDAKARDTEFSLQITYKTPEGEPGVAFEDSSRLFVISQYRRSVQLTHSNGQITEVISRDVYDDER